MSDQQVRRDVPGAASAGTPEAARILGYLQGQAAKLSVAELSDKVRTDMLQFRSALFAASADRLTERPAEDQWSVNEVAHHLARTSRMVARGIRSVLDDGELPGPVADQMTASDEVHTQDEWWARILKEREQILERVSHATGQEHPDIKWNHSVFGDLNWREWLLFMRVHDLDHARQVLDVTDALSGSKGHGTSR